MSKKGCDFLCFGNCQNKYEKHVMRKDNQEMQKVSLKKVNAIYSQSSRKGLQKIKSVSRLDPPKSLTDRSSQSAFQDELTMIRKRAQLRKELDEMNESISVISNSYRTKLQMLDNIKKEMDTIIHQR